MPQERRGYRGQGFPSYKRKKVSQNTKDNNMLEADKDLQNSQLTFGDPMNGASFKFWDYYFPQGRQFLDKNFIQE